jgi:hypothetical protein
LNGCVQFKKLTKKNQITDSDHESEIDAQIKKGEIEIDLKFIVQVVEKEDVKTHDVETQDVEIQDIHVQALNQTVQKRQDISIRMPELDNEMFCLEMLRNNLELRPLISHPVISSYIHLKWYNSKYVIILHFLKALIFMAFLFWYMCDFKYRSSLREGWSGKRIVFLCIPSFFEIFKIWKSRRDYRKIWKNLCFELCFYIIYMLTIIDCLPLYVIIPIFIFHSYEFFKMIGSLPFLTISVEIAMFEKVSITFGKSFLIFGTIPFIFAFCFHLIYFIARLETPDKTGETKNETLIEKDETAAYNTFEYFGLSLVKILAMMVGELGMSC